MILSDKRILEEMEKGTLKIEPYQRESLGSNSYDVHLGNTLATYKEHILDAKKHNQIEAFEIPTPKMEKIAHKFLNEDEKDSFGMTDIRHLLVFG